MADYGIRRLALRRREALCSWAFGAAPVALSNVECTSNDPGIDVSCSLVDDLLFDLNYTSCFTLVVYADDLGAELEGLAGGRGRQGLEESYESLAVHNTASIEFWHTWDWSRGLAGIEVDNLLGSAFEC